MNTGDIILIPFPFAEFANVKVRPAVVVCETRDDYRDLVLCAISSVVRPVLTKNEILLAADQENRLRKESVLKVDRIVTAKSQSVIARLGKLTSSDEARFRETFKQLVDSTPK
jgi:mRNA interferase MazF